MLAFSETHQKWRIALDRQCTDATMCILCVSRSSAGRAARSVLSNWGSACSLARSEQQAAARTVGGVRLFSSLPDPVQEGGNPNEKDGFVAHPSLLNADLLKAQVRRGYQGIDRNAADAA